MQLMSFTKWGDSSFLADSVQKKKLFQHVLRVSTKSQICSSLQRLHKASRLHKSNNWFWEKSGKRREERKTATELLLYRKHSRETCWYSNCLKLLMSCSSDKTVHQPCPSAHQAQFIGTLHLTRLYCTKGHVMLQKIVFSFHVIWHYLSKYSLICIHQIHLHDINENGELKLPLNFRTN
jgi:hypothetical protein